MLERLKSTLQGWIRRVADALTPGEIASRGIALALKAIALAVGGLIGLALELGYGALVDFGAGVLLMWLALGLAELVFESVRRFVEALARYLTPAGTAAVLGAATLVGTFGLPWPIVAVLASSVAIAGAALGAGVALLVRGDPRRLRAGVAIAFSVLVNAAVITLLWSDGSADDPTRALIRPAPPAPQAFATLAERGPYTVGYLTYGSGTDRRRPEYADAVAWTTPSVDASRMLPGLDGWAASARREIWGFGGDAMPLNARVWYPEGMDTPAPLVLIVHGNHNFFDYSDAGYAWLGEHLASRGFITVSVDENFLNSGPIVGGLRPENDARGWLLLEHLARWRAWNADPEHPFHGRADLGRVVLVGHSRGGEAAAIAAAFNELPHYPDDARIGFDYGFGIRGIVAIAPSDGQYQPSDKPLPLHDVSYLTIQGGLDTDVSQFMGDRQYQRVVFTPDSGHFRAAVYIHHANHGQFNTDWGRYDISGPWRTLLNIAPVMDGEAQRRAGLVLITAFVEARLNARTELDAVLRDPRVAGDALPPTLYSARYSEAGDVVLADFEEDLDLTTGTLEGVSIAASGYARWRESDLKLRGDRARGDTAQLVAWRRGEDADPRWSLKIPVGVAGPGSVLVLDLAHLDMDLPGAETRTTPVRDPLSLSVALTDERGATEVRPLSDFGALKPPLPVAHTKVGWLAKARFPAPTEPVVTSVQVPLAAFEGIDAASVRRVEIVFDGTDEGVLAIARVAMALRP